MSPVNETPNLKVFRGCFFHAPEYGHIESLLDNLMVVKDGKIVHVGPGSEEASALAEYSIKEDAVYRIKEGQFFIPGFIDTHVHAPQYKFAGTATDLPLLDWLKTYTFPTESRFSDLKAALSRYSLLLKRFLRNGTTTAMYYGTIHLEATKLLADLVELSGQRAVLGKVCMDQNSIEDYVEETNRSLEETETFVKYVRSKQCTRVDPCITPRFIPTCSMPLMKGLSNLASKYKCHIQSHISECCGEVNWVKDLHPSYGSDTELFDELGLLTNKAVMAHGTFLSDKDMKLMSRRGAAISHCPLSNFFVGDACFPVNRAISSGLKVGLGTDIAGGMSASILSAMRSAVVNSRAIRAFNIAQSGGTKVTPEMEKDVITYKEALYLATMGGAESLDLADRIGSFHVGKEFDALLVDPLVPMGPFDVFEDESPSLVVEKFLNLGDDRNILEVYVQGQLVRKEGRFMLDDRLNAPDCEADSHITEALTLAKDAIEEESLLIAAAAATSSVSSGGKCSGGGSASAHINKPKLARRCRWMIDGEDEIKRRLEACRAKRLKHL
uniref:Guanine deaminase n=1 Tax=Polytomella parva TaxID=51329 RepID=A0A7S0VP69_9CHLO|mmetsp:Transcript_8564/g.16367  ORF Transcript_8564/g.16367 Transcript_8564/m.16367 type:complete len:554 (+) Transcript_8564:189-1850(+)|eukprot:CAMPEP_0175076796 /NCGR_PEP_ID=MMETSP0052_2-20121109/22967_1 /TAXON_ID=51329 ORGANISM="Polytomella parva, Strain SAG 63-3" /NCGR_SAMPLE_ID=MMETSP0052_2 /ASSEMBLY_ACC=CAM_ASM_000194 /LENGTH=553 /DNA_ID=CAMNT_0016346057 /DNA_START=125 /DNA_END=1786 /DNA_ORIENTATION=+